MKFEFLRNGSEVLLRPVENEDVERSLRFFQGLSKEDRRYLRVDVTDVSVVQRRIQQGVDGAVFRLVALVKNRIVADGALEFSGDRWRGHMGEIRVIVDPGFRSQGLASMLIRELFLEAQKRGLEKVVMKMLAPQKNMRAICEHLGFRVEATLPDYARDQDGQLQSLIVMSCTLDEYWKAMKEAHHESSWPDG